MSVKVVIPSFLRPLTSNLETVEVEGRSISECLNNLTKRFPDVEEKLFAKNGKLLDYVGIYINGRDAFPEELAKPVKSGDELLIIYILGGG